jgi:hypothetical protein
MNLSDKNILLISPEPWGHIFVSKHHYATHLAEKGNSVYFLNPPGVKYSCKRTEYKSVHSVQYRGFIKALRFFPRAFQRQIFIRKLKKIEKLCKANFDIIWSFDNSVFFDFSALQSRVFCISHIVDLNQDFQFEISTKTANFCLATSEFIVEKQKKYNPFSFNIGHGYNRVTDHVFTFKLKGKKNINCSYAGNLDIKYIDWDLIEILLNDFPHIDFHFAGQWNSKSKFKHITNRPNFNFYGKIPSNDLPSFFEAIDVLILVYQYHKYPEQLANPHKMMEYLGSGKAIVSTWTEEYGNLSEEGLIKMAKNQKEFISAFSQVEKNLEYWNNDEKKNLRRKFASQNTYENQINRIEKIIKSHS